MKACRADEVLSPEAHFSRTADLQIPSRVVFYEHHTYFDSLSEVCVVPCVNFSWASNVGGVGEQGLQLRQHRTVGAILTASCQDGGQVEELCSLGQAHYVVPELSDFPVSHELHQTRLVVHKEEGCIVGRETVVAGLACSGGLASLLQQKPAVATYCRICTRDVRSALDEQNKSEENAGDCSRRHDCSDLVDKSNELLSKPKPRLPGWLDLLQLRQ